MKLSKAQQEVVDKMRERKAKGTNYEIWSRLFLSYPTSPNNTNPKQNEY